MLLKDTKGEIMSILKKIIASMLLVAFGASVAMAAPAPHKKKKQIMSGQYLTAVEAAAFVQKHKKDTLFVDVRTPAEIEYVGYSYLMDNNIPVHFKNFHKWSEKKHRYSDTPKNKNFVQDVKKALHAKGLNKDSKIVLMCRSGSRSAYAANKLYKAGYKNVYTVVDGFEGGKDKKHHQRSVNGWKNTAPANTWGYKNDKTKMYF